MNAHTMFGTPMITPEGSPARPLSRSLPTLDEETAQDGDKSTASPTAITHKRPVTPEHPPAPAGHKPYGTRLTTIILMRWDGQVTYIERDVWWMDEVGCVHKGGTEDRVYRFNL